MGTNLSKVNVSKSPNNQFQQKNIHSCTSMLNPLRGRASIVLSRSGVDNDKEVPREKPNRNVLTSRKKKELFRKTKKPGLSVYISVILPYKNCLPCLKFVSVSCNYMPHNQNKYEIKKYCEL